MTFEEWLGGEMRGVPCETEILRQLRRCWDAALRAQAQATREALGDLLRCACCGETEVCLDWCTLEEDDPDGANDLAVLREAVA